MPVRKFRSVEEMEAAKGGPADGAEAAARLAFVLALGARLAPRRFPPGVYKHRSIEALNEQTRRWAEADGRGRAADAEGPAGPAA